MSSSPVLKADRAAASSSVSLKISLVPGKLAASKYLSFFSRTISFLISNLVSLYGPLEIRVLGSLAQASGFLETTSSRTG